jgi:hypothetical protein
MADPALLQRPNNTIPIVCMATPAEIASLVAIFCGGGGKLHDGADGVRRWLAHAL